jgi:conjugal transfer/entry exclusion protein
VKASLAQRDEEYTKITEQLSEARQKLHEIADSLEYERKEKSNLEKQLNIQTEEISRLSANNTDDHNELLQQISQKEATISDLLTAQSEASKQIESAKLQLQEEIEQHNFAKEKLSK